MDFVDDEMLAIFAEECSELLESSEQALLQLEDDPGNDDLVNDLFRTFHTIKGSSGIFGLDLLVAFTHVAENVLDKVRDHVINLDNELISLFLECRDHLQALVEVSLSGHTVLTDELEVVDKNLVGRLNVYLDGIKTESTTLDGQDSTAEPVSESDNEERVKNACWHISLRFAEDALRNGMDPASFIHFLSKLGSIRALSVIDSKLPDWPDFDPESCYLGFEISLDTDADKAEIEEVFEFVQDDCEISILPPESKISDYVNLINNLSDEDMRLGAILVEIGALTQRELDQSLNRQNKLDR